MEPYTIDRNAVFDAFFETEVWTGLVIDPDSGTMEPLDSLGIHFVPDDFFGVESMRAMVADFCDMVERELSSREWAAYRRHFPNDPEDAMGHDLSLTRQGHGAGFWDRGLDDLGDALTKIAKSFSGEGILASYNHGDIELEWD